MTRATNEFESHNLIRSGRNNLQRKNKQKSCHGQKSKGGVTSNFEGRPVSKQLVSCQLPQPNRRRRRRPGESGKTNLELSVIENSGDGISESDCSNWIDNSKGLVYNST